MAATATTTAAVRTVWRGSIVHSLSFEKLEVLPKACLGLFDNGRIAFLHKKEASLEELKEKEYPDLPWASDCHLREVPPKGFLAPGFIDTHTHAPQYVFSGTAMDLGLLDWLNKYTFPTEAKFGEKEFAVHVYDKVVQRTLRSGTTTCAYYGTIHREGTRVLAETVHKYGQRAFVGKVSMDRNSPETYIEASTEDALADAEAFVQDVLSLGDPLVQPALTPRFVPTCTLELMKGLGALAKKHDLFIQSHISENKNEVAWVKDLHPQYSSYAEVYEACSLMTEKTVMAHGIYLTEEEIELFKKTGASISHCPNSNFTLHSGVLNVRHLMEKGLSKIAVGTDVSGGYSPSMLDALRNVVTASNVISFYEGEGKKEKGYAPLTFAEAFYLCTLAGANVFGLAEETGNFLPGKCFDALVVDAEAEGSPFDVFSSDELLDIFEKWLFLGDDRNIKQVIVNGRAVDLPSSSKE
ncbi:Guanine deaminase [Balamuthia mandrillaris]